MFHRTDVSISVWKPYIIWFYVRSTDLCIIISVWGFILIFFILWWYEKDISLLIFIAQNCQNVHWNLRNASVFQDLTAIFRGRSIGLDNYKGKESLSRVVVTPKQLLRLKKNYYHILISMAVSLKEYLIRQTNICKVHKM